MIYNVVIQYISFNKNLLNAYHTRQAGAKVKKQQIAYPWGSQSRALTNFPGLICTVIHYTIYFREYFSERFSLANIVPTCQYYR